MQRGRTLTSFAVLASLIAGSVHADCGFNAPARASGLKTSLVRAYAPCNGGFTFPFPNTVSSAGVPACAPPTPILDADDGDCLPANCSYAASTYSFAADGRCSVKLRQYVTDDCGDAPDAPAACLSLVARAVCTGIRDIEDKPTHSKQFSLRTLLRFTTNDGSPATLIDWMETSVLHVAGGKIADYVELWSHHGVPLPTCTQVQVLRIELLDDVGFVFATMGSSTR